MADPVYQLDLRGQLEKCGNKLLRLGRHEGFAESERAMGDDGGQNPGRIRRKQLELRETERWLFMHQKAQDERCNQFRAKPRTLNAP
jgi:hypothetical protein